jgi:hypothetical protein
VFEEEVTWARRKIGDPSAVRNLYLVNGAQFVIVAVLGAVLLTGTASSAPLQGLWKDLPQHLTSISQWLQRFAPPGGDLNGIGEVTFGNGAITNGRWRPSNSIAFRARFDRAEQQKFKWRAGTYSEYTGFGWNWGPTRTEVTPARSIILDGDSLGDKPVTDGRREIDYSLSIDSFIGPTVFGPNTLLTVDRETNALVLGNGWFTSVETQGNSGGYSVTALVPDLKATTGAITEPRLRTAGTDYPAELMALYGPASLPKDALGGSATALLSTIKSLVRAPSYADPSNPYDLARTMETYLHDDDNFTYDPDVVDERNAQCQGVSTVECFARIRRGYCDFYASTMTVLLRASGVPARVAYGFLPGNRGTDGVEVVSAAGAHYWVEVYFPGIGWIEFDPTGGGIGRPVAIPTGSPLPATPKPSGRPTIVPGSGFPTFGTGGGSTDNTNPGTGIGPFIAIALILLVGFGALGFAAIRRTPRKPMHPDQAWGAVSRLASRFGLGPRPSQTVYEYAGALGDTVPAARVELTTIARAKVEVAYGRSELGADRLHRIAEAYQRLRFALLGVILRRVLRRGRPSRRSGRGR